MRLLCAVLTVLLIPMIPMAPSVCAAASEYHAFETYTADCPLPNRNLDFSGNLENKAPWAGNGELSDEQVHSGSLSLKFDHNTGTGWNTVTELDSPGRVFVIYTW